MSFAEFVLLLMSVIASVTGQLFLKLGAAKLGRVYTVNVISQILSIVTTPELLIGLSSYSLGAIFYILLLTRVELSIAGPSASLVYVFSVLIGFFVFEEAIPPMRLIGLSLIVGGVVLVVCYKSN